PMLNVGHNAKKRKTSHSNYKEKAVKGKFDCGSKRKGESKIAPTSDPKEAVCFYCKCNTKGHWKRSCLKYLKDLKDRLVKKGGHSDLKESRRLKHGELNLVMGNRKITLVIRIGKYELMLKSEDGYQFSFDNENGDILIYSNSCFMFKASPCKGIYETVKCISHNGNVILNVGSSNELDKSKLRHSRLGNINKKCITQLQKDGVLESFDFKSDDVFWSCLLGKMTKSPFTDGNRYYVMFTDDFSRYRYVYLIKHKSDTIKVFKGYENEVENQLNRKIKMWKGKRPSLGHIKIWGCKVFVKREAQDKLEARSEKYLFVGYPEESFGYLFYKPKDNVSVDEEPIVNTNTQQKVVTPVKPDDISLPIRRTSGGVSKPLEFYYGFHIEEDKISDSTLSELDEPPNYKEAMASPKASKWKEAMKSEI
ncbi:retrotransposon protein, putative, ty1-copia subclass, partial [Tanacetum coccineum]